MSESKDERKGKARAGSRREMLTFESTLANFNPFYDLFHGQSDAFRVKKLSDWSKSAIDKEVERLRIELRIKSKMT